MLDKEIVQRMDAYRGNPQALAQRYQQSQQLIDLLALQKLKSEKEAAARSLQMQQTPQGGLPTVAQQREKEVMDMTRQEVAQQVGQTGEQEEQKQQAAMKQLLSGIARAPGAANAMPPQAMAAGGIVAFQTGGASRLSDEDEEERKQLDSARAPIVRNPQDIAARVLAPGQAPSTQAARANAVGGLGSARELAERLTGVDQSRTRASESQREGLAALQGAIQNAQLKASDYPGMRPEDLSARQAEIAAAKERMQKEFDPESERLNQLIATLAAMGGRTSLGSMGAAGAQAAMGREAQREAARRERLKEVGGMEENLRQRQEAERLGKFQAEQAAADRAVNAKTQAAKLANDLAEGDARRASELLNSGLRIAAEAGMTDAKLNAEIDMLARRLDVQMSIEDRKNLTDMLKIAASERATAAQVGKESDARIMINAYKADFMRQGLGEIEAEARAAEKYQREFRDVAGRAAATQAKTYTDILRSTPYLALIPKLQSSDPKVRADAETERAKLFTDAGLNPNDPAARPGAGTDRVLPMPRTQAELRTGQLYNTARGTARWDGTQFIPEGQ